MESGSYGDGYRDARKHAGQEVQILVRNATEEFKRQVTLLIEDNQKLRKKTEVDDAEVEELNEAVSFRNAEIERLREALHAIVASDWKNGVCADIARAALGEDLA